MVEGTQKLDVIMAQGPGSDPEGVGDKRGGVGFLAELIKIGAEAPVLARVRGSSGQALANHTQDKGPDYVAGTGGKGIDEPEEHRVKNAIL